MKISIKLCILTLFLITGFGSADAESSEAKEAILKYFEAFKSFDTASMSNMIHPDALKQFRDVFDGALYGSKSDLAKTEILPLFAVSNLDEYTELTNVEAFERLYAIMPADLIHMIQSSQFNIVIVTESIQDDLAYFTYSVTLEKNGQSATSDAVQKLKLFNDSWMLLLPAEAEAAVAAIAARYN